MGMKRFPLRSENSLSMRYRPHEKVYAAVELNQVAFQIDGRVESQMPLGEAFTIDDPCENGMWVVADYATGAVNPPAAATDKLIGIVYTTEKEYDDYHYGLQYFGRKVKGDYPRIGFMDEGDSITSNCFQYDDTEFTDASGAKEHSALFAALKAANTTPVYVVPVADSPIPKLTATKPSGGFYAKVAKFYTMPNGEPGVMYQVISR